RGVGESFEVPANVLEKAGEDRYVPPPRIGFWSVHDLHAFFGDAVGGGADTHGDGIFPVNNTAPREREGFTDPQTMKQRQDSHELSPTIRLNIRVRHLLDNRVHHLNLRQLLPMRLHTGFSSSERARAN